MARSADQIAEMNPSISSEPELKEQPEENQNGMASQGVSALKAGFGYLSSGAKFMKDKAEEHKVGEKMSSGW